MRIFLIFTVILFALCVTACGSQDSPRILNFDPELETDSDSEFDDGKIFDEDSESELETDSYEEDTMVSSDLAASGMWRCLICDPEE